MGQLVGTSVHSQEGPFGPQQRDTEVVTATLSQTGRATLAAEPPEFPCRHSGHAPWSPPHFFSATHGIGMESGAIGNSLCILALVVGWL